MEITCHRQIKVFALTGLTGWLAAPAFGDSSTLRLTLESEAGQMHLRWASQPGERFQIEHRTNLFAPDDWQALSTNWPAVGTNTAFVHADAPKSGVGFYRVLRFATPDFTFAWNGTNFTYTDWERTFTGILLRPAGNGPFPAVIVNHGAGGTATGYSLTKARELLPWGLVCIGPTLTHVAGGETNPANLGHCAENIARAVACANVLAGLGMVDTNRIALFGHSMGAFATIGDAAALGDRVRTAVITAGGVIPDSAGTTNAAPTMSEAAPVRTSFLMFHCDADPVVPAGRSQLFQQMLNSNAVPNLRMLYASNSIPNQNHWHNLHQDAAVNADILTNTFQWLQARGVLP